MSMDSADTETNMIRVPVCSGPWSRAVSGSGLHIDRVRCWRAQDDALRRKLLVMLPLEILCVVVDTG